MVVVVGGELQLALGAGHARCDCSAAVSGSAEVVECGASAVDEQTGVGEAAG